jgi:hypothetical protein
MEADIKIGDILVIFPDEDSLAGDRQKGYFLATSFGKVVDILSERRQVRVTWLFTESYSSKLRPWFLPSGEQYSGILNETEIFTGDSNVFIPMKAKLDSSKKLTKETISMIKAVIGEDEIMK